MIFLMTNKTELVGLRLTTLELEQVEKWAEKLKCSRQKAIRKRLFMNIKKLDKK